MIRGPALVALIGILCAPAAAHAHARSVSYSTWTLDGDRARVRLSLSRLDASAIDAAAAGSLLVLTSAAGACRTVPGSPTRALAPGDATRALFRWTVRCPSTERLRLRSGLTDVLPGHLHFARVEHAGRESPERVLGGGVEELEVFDEPSSAGTFGRHAAIGVEHILRGWDHLLFLLVLLVATRRWKDAVPIVTGFTLGHSASLAVAALGLARPDTGTVEALVALSIVLVAVENVWLAEGRDRLALPAGAAGGLLAFAALLAIGGRAGALALLGMALFAASHFGLLRRAQRPERGRWAVASLFGLVHGFAFAGVLDEAGLTRAELPLALLGFNAGVELGQLAVVACVWPALAWWRRRARRAEAPDPLVSWASGLAACAGTFAFVTRVL